MLIKKNLNLCQTLSPHKEGIDIKETFSNKDRDKNIK
jgi:hypothetical protein